MTIVCLGWGSLIWCQKALPVSGTWHADGPALPVEFARESNDKRITLVITDGAAPVQTFWAALDVDDLASAQNSLAAREGIKPEYVSNSIGTWSACATGAVPDGLATWAMSKGFSHVVWTALKPKIGNRYRTPTVAEVIDHLKGLRDSDRDRAEEYIRMTPRQILTSYRSAIEEALGWAPNGLI